MINLPLPISQNCGSPCVPRLRIAAENRAIVESSQPVEVPPAGRRGEIRADRCADAGIPQDLVQPDQGSGVRTPSRNVPDQGEERDEEQHVNGKADHRQHEDAKCPEHQP